MDTTHSLIFTYGLGPAAAPSQATPGKPASTQTAEGVWWKQEPDVSGFVSLANPSALSIPATVQVSDDQGTLLQTATVTVSPHGTKLVAVSKLGATARAVGGVHVTYQATDGSTLIVNGGIEDRNSGYSAAIPFVSSPTTSADSYDTTVAEIGLMTGAADPMMAFPAGTRFTPYSVMRNVSTAPLTLAPTAWWVEGGNSKSAPLPTLTLAPGESRTLDMPALLATTRLKNYNGSFTLAFDVQGKRGGLLMAAGSVDQTNTYVFEVTPRAATESASKSLAYWSTANGDDTMVNLWNPADEAQDLIFKLTYAGGHYSLPVHLAARATRMFNISEIIQAQIPDAEGNVIPVSVQEGSGRISGGNADNESILIGIDAGTYNVRKATCGVICFVCDGAASNSLTPNPFEVTIDGQLQMDFTVTYNTGGQYDLTSQSTWNADSVSVTSSGLASGLTAGSAWISVVDRSVPIAGEICLTAPADNPCPVIFGPTEEVLGTVNDPTPVVSSVSPSSWNAGQVTSITIGGKGFGTAPTVAISGPSGSIPFTQSGLPSDTSIAGTVSVPANSAGGSATVTVTSHGYNGSGFICGTACQSTPNGSNNNVQVDAVPNVTPTITLNGTKLTSLSSVPITAGQQVVLTATLPSAQSQILSSQGWGAPTGGTAIGGYVNAAGTGPPDTTGGRLLPTAPTTTASTTFYWVSSTSTPSVQFTYQLSNGNSSNATTVTFNVAAAPSVSLSTPTGSVGIFSGPVLGYGPVGIAFNTNTTTKNGQFVWIQIITKDVDTLTPEGGSSETCVNVTVPPTTSGTGLDSGYPYATGSSTSDSPNGGLNGSQYSSEGRSFTATMYLLWNPALPAGCMPGSSCTSVPVPLKSINWGWSGLASYSGGAWSLTSSGTTAPSVSSGTYPTWSVLVPYNGKIQCN